MLGALPAREVVGVEPVPVVVGNPGRLAVRREAARGAVPLIEIEFRPLPAFAAREVVGIDAAVGVRAGLGDPEGRAVGPQSRGPLVVGVELVEIVFDGPLEVHAAGRPGRPVRPGAGWLGDRDRHVDARGRTRGVGRGDRGTVGVLLGGIEHRARSQSELARVLVDVERPGRAPGEPVRHLVAVLIDRGNRRTDSGAGGRAAVDESDGRCGRERGCVVYGPHVHDDCGRGRVFAIGDAVREGVGAVVVGPGRVGDGAVGLHRRGAAFRRGLKRHRQEAALGIGVVVKHVYRCRLALVRRRRVPHGRRRLVDVLDGDRHGRRGAGV